MCQICAATWCRSDADKRQHWYWTGAGEWVQAGRIKLSRVTKQKINGKFYQSNTKSCRGAQVQPSFGGNPHHRTIRFYDAAAKAAVHPN